jgi:hypothetical protein
MNLLTSALFASRTARHDATPKGSNMSRKKGPAAPDPGRSDGTIAARDRLWNQRTNPAPPSRRRERLLAKQEHVSAPRTARHAPRC